MKAAILQEIGSPLVIGTLPDPISGTGEIIVDVAAAPVLSYTNEVISGKRKHYLELPMAIGCGGIGRVRAVGPDATSLKIGDWVICDPTIRSRDNIISPDIALQGWTATGQGSIKLQQHFHHGSFAEQMLMPAENVFRIDSFKEKDAPLWCAAGTLLVPYGGLLTANLQPGETLLVSGATGNFGSSAIAVALAMGAGCVIAPGRNKRVLEDLTVRFGDRVRTVVLSGNEDDDRKAMLEAAPDAIDCVLDILPPEAPATVVRTALMTVRPYGRVILMGGVGMQGGTGLELAYPWIMRNCITIYGQWMYPPRAVVKLISLIRSGLLSLDNFEISAFGLDQANEAIEHAAANAGPFRLTVLKP